MAEQFTETTTTLAAFAGCLPETVRLYGKLGLLDSLRLQSGVQLFKRSEAPKVRQIMAERLKRRGRRRVESPESVTDEGAKA